MTDEKRGGDGPVPVRDLMKQMVSRPEAEGEPRWEGTEHTFEWRDESWTARAAGAWRAWTTVRWAAGGR